MPPPLPCALLPVKEVLLAVRVPVLWMPAPEKPATFSVKVQPSTTSELLLFDAAADVAGDVRGERASAHAQRGEVLDRRAVDGGVMGENALIDAEGPGVVPDGAAAVVGVIRVERDASDDGRAVVIDPAGAQRRGVFRSVCCWKG
jgi:hypothetical protein